MELHCRQLSLSEKSQKSNWTELYSSASECDNLCHFFGICRRTVDILQTRCSWWVAMLLWDSWQVRPDAIAKISLRSKPRQKYFSFALRFVDVFANYMVWCIPIGGLSSYIISRCLPRRRAITEPVSWLAYNHHAATIYGQSIAERRCLLKAALFQGKLTLMQAVIK